MKFALHTLLSKLARERERLGFFALVLLFCTAPTPGDVGGCGQKPAELDPGTFFASKANTDCQRCQECGLTRASCANACNAPESYPSAFPENCLPLVHDGEVCLRALLHASCDDYASYMSDSSPSVPTECNFCPEPAP
ncbi:MAG TPA: hypothetical protein VJV79_22365 [Polyangiaceae bacterium]|nr:hypothetical protein [Polyangiaceae bacterium]